VLTLSPLRLGGPTGYSNELYWNPIGGGNNVSDFTYDLYFYIDQPLVAQALEFDLNQTFGGTRWVWGSECHFKQTGRWNPWDDLHGKWIPAYVDSLSIEDLGPPGVDPRARRQPSALHQPSCGGPQLRDRYLLPG
jgi:hypothetical protein